MMDFRAWFLEKHGYYPMRKADQIEAGLAFLMDEMSVWATAMLEEASSVARAHADQVDVAAVAKALEGKK